MKRNRECQNQEVISQCALSMGKRKERGEVARVKMECDGGGRGLSGSLPRWSS